MSKKASCDLKNKTRCYNGLSDTRKQKFIDGFFQASLAKESQQKSGQSELPIAHKIDFRQLPGIYLAG